MATAGQPGRRLRGCVSAVCGGVHGLGRHEHWACEVRWRMWVWVWARARVWVWQVVKEGARCTRGA